jgi:cytoskeleton protein RodZ
MALFQRVKTPFAEYGTDGEGPPPAGPRSAGEALRQQREALRRDLKDVAEALRIKPAYLAALEEGRPDRLPGPAYAAGFVRAYGDHLGLDGAEILRRFRLEASGLDAKPDLSFPMPLGEGSVPGGAMLLVALILAICGYGTWYYLSIGERSRPARVTEVPITLLPPKPETPMGRLLPAPMAATAPARNTGPAGSQPSAPLPASKASGEALAADTTVRPPAAATSLAISGAPVTISAAASVREPATASERPGPGTGRDVASGPALGIESETPPRDYGAVEQPVRIVLRASADSWIQVRDADHSVLYTGVLKLGEAYRVPDRAGLSMRAGNAGGLEVTVDGKPVPSLGPIGAVRNVALDPQLLTAKSTLHN